MSETNSQTTVTTHIERQARGFSWIQLGATLVLSLASSIAVVSWTISASNTYITWSIRDHDDRIKRLESTMANNGTRLATIEANQVAGLRRSEEREARLVRIENKLDDLTMMLVRGDRGKR